MKAYNGGKTMAELKTLARAGKLFLNHWIRVFQVTDYTQDRYGNWYPSIEGVDGCDPRPLGMLLIAE